MHTSRRHVLTGALGFGGALSLAGPAQSLATSRSPGVSLRTDPFTLGVASGDPTPDGVVLWTRLAVDPLDDSGRGGLPDLHVAVRYEVAEDEHMRKVVRRGGAVADPAAAHTVHVEVQGLRPGREYWYRFQAGRYTSAVARTRTAPAGHELPSALTMAFASCANFEQGWFTAYRRLAQENPDLVLHLGDYTYESEYTPTGIRKVRKHAGPETSDLATYRLRHAQYKTDPDLQAAHAVAPWLVVFDDHEVDNNWAADIPENSKPQEGNDTTAHFRARRAAAFQAYWEHMPLRRASLPSQADMKVFRRLHWGRLASFHMMDTRQYRDDQACGDGQQADCDARLDPSRTMTGARQERWLLDGFKASRARWDFLGQQVFFSEIDEDPGPGQKVPMDAWDGYVASRQRLTKGWVDAGVRNPVVLTGDCHRHWAADVKVDFVDPDSPVVGSELICTAITSTGDGNPDEQDVRLPFNKHLKYYRNRRGYVSTTIRPDRLQADYQVVDSVTSKDAPVRTDASFELFDGQRGLVRRS